MSVVGNDFELLKKFNLAEIYEPTPRPVIATTPTPPEATDPPPAE